MRLCAPARKEACVFMITAFDEPDFQNSAVQVLFLHCLYFLGNHAVQAQRFDWYGRVRYAEEFTNPAVLERCVQRVSMIQ